MSKFHVRPYKESDYEEIVSWWNAANEPGPVPGEMAENGTFVLEIHGVPSMSLTLFLTQSKGVSFIEGFIAKPGLPKDDRREGGEMLWFVCYAFAKANGYTGVTTYAKNEGLVARYEQLGMTRSVSGLTALHKQIQGVA